MFYFSVQYDMIGWAPKEYNPADTADTGMHKGIDTEAGVAGEGENGAPQSSFVWDEASGYYYDAVSGFYYDGNRGNSLLYWVVHLNAFVQSSLCLI